MSEAPLPEKLDLRALQEVYDAHGPLSEAFRQQVWRFILYLQHRYTGHCDDDLQQMAYERLLRSFDYYDPTKMNLASWVHTIVRNQCSKHNYRTKKQRKESPEPLETLPDERDPLAALVDDDCAEAAMRAFVHLDVLDEGGEFLKDPVRFIRRNGVNDAFGRHVLWEGAGTLSNFA